MPQSQTRTLRLNRAASPLARLVALFLAALARRHERARLARLDNHLLQDIGLEPETVAEECAKPCWQV